jgi:hypothetical protein
MGRLKDKGKQTPPHKWGEGGFGRVPETFCEHSVNIPGTFREHFGNIRSFWEHFGTNPGTQRANQKKETKEKPI